MGDTKEYGGVCYLGLLGVRELREVFRSISFISQFPPAQSYSEFVQKIFTICSLIPFASNSLQISKCFGIL